MPLSPRAHLAALATLLVMVMSSGCEKQRCTKDGGTWVSGQCEAFTQIDSSACDELCTHIISCAPDTDPLVCNRACHSQLDDTTRACALKAGKSCTDLHACILAQDSVCARVCKPVTLCVESIDVMDCLQSCEVEFDEPTRQCFTNAQTCAQLPDCVEDTEPSEPCDLACHSLVQCIDDVSKSDCKTACEAGFSNQEKQCLMNADTCDELLPCLDTDMDDTCTDICGKFAQCIPGSDSELCYNDCTSTWADPIKTCFVESTSCSDLAACVPSDPI